MKALDDNFRLKLVGYFTPSLNGFAIPIFGSSFDANVLYTAVCYPAGDHNGVITNFSEVNPDNILPIDIDKQKEAQIGSSWLDVLLWAGHVFVGTPKEIWNESANILLNSKHSSSVIVLDIAIYAGISQVNNFIRNAYQYIKRRFGFNHAVEFVATILRREIVLEIQRSGPNQKEWPSNAEIESLVYIDYDKNVGYKILLDSEAMEILKNKDYDLGEGLIGKFRKALDIQIFVEYVDSASFAYKYRLYQDE